IKRVLAQPRHFLAHKYLAGLGIPNHLDNRQRGARRSLDRNNMESLICFLEQVHPVLPASVFSIEGHFHDKIRTPVELVSKLARQLSKDWARN
ncbi:hypothetical protein, partial [Erythrobacter sp. YJ-T3-07]|uniref:hypothetical protein n=1 Tax=Erythrobacter sp. YJ-T3-07 TaxID=2793063 RepID=UPI001F417E12